jgi:adenylate cyclase
MAEIGVTRRLAAILAADMVGYSRLMEADEAGTIARQKAHHAELIDPTIAACNGRIVKTTGDGLLVEFASAVDAVSCAVAVQRGMAEREAGVPAERRIAYRVGVNLGEIVIDGDDILGDGVNLAARLEALAEPGGIRISDVVFRNVKGKLDLGFADLGLQKVKNIAQPVATYRVLLDPDAAGTLVSPKRRTHRRPRLAAAAAVLLLAAAGASWWQPWAPDVEPAQRARMKHPLPNKPSVAVLPFADLSAGKKQSLLADGITEDIITDLARIENLFVIARNSTFTYKGKPVKVQQVSEELGVRYVVEGSVRRSGDKIRITVQLIDALSGQHVWAQRYDREVKDIFRVQDEIVTAIATKLVRYFNVVEGGKRYARNLDAYHLVIRARREILAGSISPAGIARARRLAESALALDPGYARAHAELANILALEARFGGVSSARKNALLARAVEEARRAVALDKSDHWGYRMLGFALMSKGDLDGAIAAFDKAIALAPTNADTLNLSALPLVFSGQFDKAIARVRTAMRLNPYYDWVYPDVLGFALYQKGDYAQAVVALEKALRLNPKSVIVKRDLAAAYAQTGRIAEAKALVAELLKANPKLSASRPRLPFKNPAHSAHYQEGLRKAGMPEK